MQILKNLYQVGGSLNGVTSTILADPFDDGNVYVLDLNEELVLFDCGNGETLEQILTNMEYWGLAADKVSTCFITHSHWDHAGAAHLLKKRGINLVAHPVTAEAIACGDERCCGYLYHKKFVTCETDKTLFDGQSLKINGLKIQARHFPGHTLGCTAFCFEWESKSVVVSGDIIGTLGYGYFGWDGSFDFDKKVYLQSLTQFAKLDFDIMLPGHGLIYFDRPRRRVEEALNEALIQWR